MSSVRAWTVRRTPSRVLAGSSSPPRARRKALAGVGSVGLARNQLPPLRRTPREAMRDSKACGVVRQFPAASVGSLIQRCQAVGMLGVQR